MPGGVMPCLELPNGKKMGETKLLLKYLAGEHGYFPTDADEAQAADEVAECIMEKFGFCSGPAFAKDPAIKE
jgi:glutathione S-transferase